MLTVDRIVIEFFCVLYMWATDARVLVTIKLQQTKNPDPCLGHLSTRLFFGHGFFNCMDLLSFGELWGSGVGGFLHGCFSGFGLAIVGVFWAAARHVALYLTPETPSFSGQLGTLFWCELFEIGGGGGGIHIYWDYVGV